MCISSCFCCNDFHRNAVKFRSANRLFYLIQSYVYHCLLFIESPRVAWQVGGGNEDEREVNLVTPRRRGEQQLTVVDVELEDDLDNSLGIFNITNSYNIIVHSSFL